ncbi:DUF3613 domain-containing protein [Vibrio toranzoniae]|uniref:DUF3613 domain-containing protein n=1 Tax=Vibrio toranzoniae TaxID=1194427 RepID=UPI001377FFB0|nr:DUF3613 domain-containing protein [Vibrio toranzoniae]NAZ98354.1 DUF3613 domain-containing protein [Vibrio toranzoniae]
MKALFLLGITIGYSCISLAQQLPSNPQKGEEITVQYTRIWLEIQRENMLATSHKDALTPEVSKAVQERVEASFSHAIPEKFIKNDFGE